jgi:RNA polymerase sigma-70 factor (ECF subfamily)
VSEFSWEDFGPRAQLYMDCPRWHGLGDTSVQADPNLDLELLRRSANGSGPAFHDLVDRHADRLFRLAMSLTGQVADAEDVLQETFAGAFKSARTFKGESSVGTWLTRILVRQVALWRRSRANKRTTLLESHAGVPSSAGHETGIDARVDLQAALKQLSDEHREVLVLREFEQLSYEEIASVLEIPRGTVESRIHRARGELRDKLKAYR